MHIYTNLSDSISSKLIAIFFFFKDVIVVQRVFHIDVNMKSWSEVMFLGSYNKFFV